MMRMVRDVFHISGFLVFGAFDQVVQIVLNRHSRRAHQLVGPLQKSLAPFHIVVTLGESVMSQRDMNAHENGLY
jgi:hypothetical protein